MDQNQIPPSRKKPHWPIVRKCQIIGAITAAGITTIILAASSVDFNIAWGLGGIILTPTGEIVKLFGLEKWLYNHEGFSVTPFIIGIIINAIIGFLAGTVVGFVIKCLKTQKNQL